MEYYEFRERKPYEIILRNSGIYEAFRKKTFDTFQDKGNSELQKTKIAAIMYCKQSTQLQNNISNSIAFLGQVGAGKTTYLLL
ncbi:hypothetical protein [Tepidibacter aestuarii]|uniref:hypothetical protein n=1 Tax=Tepidibacter aestuarii TaxID=2925782 RepID=UPI0020BF1F05|nr:hypothetical protein [Tepidibacter aestuarii]CAH2213242.1 protein of unknown function [Tepidibacter aestuarii]